ncbi:MAG: hypothetical protein M5Z89_04995 [Olivibacter sp.]|nr:hypothetical protein [Olivibacter sp. UJ_SKK_5.1]
MKKTYLILLLFALSLTVQAKDYISYYLVHTGVDHTLKEHTRQTNIRNQQAAVGVLEETNKSETNRLKQSYDKVISRLSKLGLAIDAAFMVQEAYPTLNMILNTQRSIIDQVSNHPHLIPFAIQNELFVINKARTLVNYMAGLILSIGDLNQMKAGDRKLLLAHALNELRAVSGMSYKMLSVIRGRIMAERLRKAGMIAWVNREKDLIGDIIQNAKRI